MLTPLRALGVTRYHRPQKNYTPLRNAFVRDAQVSLRAFRVGAYVLSHADGFVQTQAQIAAACGLAVNTVRAALDDLRRAGHLVSKIVREHGRVVGTAYAISDTPFTPEEVAALTSEDVASEPYAESAHAESAPPKKIRSRRDSSYVEEDHPSGGAADAAPLEEPMPEEEPMPPATDPAQAQLFDVEASQPPPAEARKPEGAQAVIAAYVEAWREHNPEGEPLKAHKGRIARDAKALLTKSEATEEELVAAARAMAATPFSNLGVQLNIQRRGRGRSATVGHSIPLPADHPSWARGAAEDAARRAAEGVSPEVEALRARYVQAGVA
jgi:hypothetical protein